MYSEYEKRFEHFVESLKNWLKKSNSDEWFFFNDFVKTKDFISKVYVSVFAIVLLGGILSVFELQLFSALGAFAICFWLSKCWGRFIDDCWERIYKHHIFRVKLSQHAAGKLYNELHSELQELCHQDNLPQNVKDVIWEATDTLEFYTDLIRDYSEEDYISAYKAIYNKEK